MARKRNVAGPKPVEMFIIVGTDDLKDIQRGCFVGVDILGSGLSEREAVESANAMIDGDVQDADMTLVKISVENAFGLHVESKLVL